MGEEIYMRSLLKNHHLFHIELIHMECFFMLLRAVTLWVGNFLNLTAEVVLDWIASVVVAIKKKDRAHFQLKLSYDIEPNYLVPLFAYFFGVVVIFLGRSFFCICFTPCVFLRGYWTKLPSAFLLTLAYNWSGFSDRGIVKLEFSTFSHRNAPP